LIVLPRKLTTPSYLVLGLVEMLQPVTPYELKRFAAHTVVNFWSLPHTQIYAQCDRLLEDGHLTEEREQGGRRRRKFSITESGSAALEQWRTSPSEQQIEMRDLATLKLFFGGDPLSMARDQIAIHERQLARYLAIKEAGPIAGGPDLALESGIAIERQILKIWKQYLK
jgi:DNA-binding PadR family transcriptional regulator